uniref:Putative methyltransferase n=1 Tax=viral metagenome TaxID=1070528 RepID=A0A6M3KA20_9ZZZZ
MKYFSMFSGIGGFGYGIEQITKEWECIGYSEIDKYASSIYRLHYPDHKAYGDANEINPRQLPDFDLLVGGFPCQAFSIAGKRRGFEDTRGTLFFEIARVLVEKRPRYFLLENVKGLLSHSKGQTFQTILGVLSDIGYDYQWQVLNSKDFGVPQNRERVFIVGHIRGECRPEVFPIGSVCEQDNKPNNGGVRLIQDKRQSGETRLWENNSPAVTSYWGLGGGNVPYVGSNIYGVAINQFIRRLTPIECERLQAFPDCWTQFGVDVNGNLIEISDTQRYKCLGNAVTTNVITAIMERLYDRP